MPSCSLPDPLDTRPRPTCGNRIYHDNPAAPEILRVKTGAFNVEMQGEPLAHLYAKHAASWVRMAPDTLVYETQTTFSEFLEAMRARG